MTRPDNRGQFAASVSIRSGRGSASHDRVFRLVPVFATRDAAARYATAQGLAWIGGRSTAAPAPATNQE